MMEREDVTIGSAAGGVDFVRTPEERFEGLAGFDWEAKYTEVDGLRMAYIDVGPADAETFLLLHGEPAWSYLYRRMIPILTDGGFRCIAPDLIGFGRSDKPVEEDVYTYAQHLDWLGSFVEQVAPATVNLFAQDWGGLLGLRLVAAEPDRFSRVAIGNTGLPTGESLGDGFDAWLAFSQSEAFDDVGALFQRAIQARRLTPAEVDGYRAPFPDRRYMAGAIRFPALVPITPDHPQVFENREAWKVLERYERPFLTVWCPGDPVLGHLGDEFIERVAGAAGQPHRKLTPGGHFIQDDRGEDVAEILIDWVNETGTP